MFRDVDSGGGIAMAGTREKKPAVEAGQIWHGGIRSKGYQDSRRVVVRVEDGNVVYDTYPVRLGEKKAAVRNFRAWAKYVVRSK